MADTSTFITWPSKLKIGAKSRKDPHVRIAGKEEDVLAAKERIMTALDTRVRIFLLVIFPVLKSFFLFCKSNRVTMKMDVSYVCHSHIIGKCGLSIKRIMEETKCHIHFPDSNRTNNLEKSNQVSISGDIQGAEVARSRVRQKTPIVFGFELPVMSPVVDQNCAYFVKIQEQYNVQIMLRTRPKLHATLVSVKGSEWEVEQVKKATSLLVEYLCNDVADQVPIEMSLEISPRLHTVVSGTNHSNIKDIMRVTGTKVFFPDAQDPNLPCLKKSHVYITGNIHGVYYARQLLIGSLPLVMMFDLPTSISLQSISREQVVSIQSKYDVTINIRKKATLNVMMCIIEGAEKYATNIYKARNAILDIDDLCVVADIPTNYYLPSVPPTLPRLQVTVPPEPIISHVSPSLHSPMFHHPNEQCPPYMLQQWAMCNSLHSNASSGYQSTGVVSQTSQEHSPAHSSYSPMSSITPLSTPVSSSRNGSPNCHSYNFQDQSEKPDISTVFNELNSPGFHGPTVDKSAPGSSSWTMTDYEQKRIAGLKAMQQRPTGLRYPNNSWSGYGISHTSPAPVPLTGEDVLKTPTSNKTFDFRSPALERLSADLNTSNFMDHTSPNMLNRLTSTDWTDLTTLITSLKLEKYLPVFHSHEIDLATFASMNGKELLEVGVTAFGARRKMLLAIAELRKRMNAFSLAPGAERKSSSSNPCSPHEKW
nr:protein bicaudal C isoform X1 [Onthophagus taurus]